MKKFTKSRKALIIFCYVWILLFFAIQAHSTNIQHKFFGENEVRYFERQLQDESYIYSTCSRSTYGFECEETTVKVPGLEYENAELIDEHYANNKLAYDTPTSLGLLMAFIILFSTLLSFTTSQIEAVELDGKIYHVDKKRETRFHNEFTYIALSFLLFLFFSVLIVLSTQLVMITYFVSRKKLL